VCGKSFGESRGRADVRRDEENRGRERAFQRVAARTLTEHRNKRLTSGRVGKFGRELRSVAVRYDSYTLENFIELKKENGRSATDAVP
jgi:hypothetical protein